MAQVTQVTVPDIGDFESVDVIEVHVGPGDSVAPEDPLITLESDKATMDVPSPVGGVVEEVLLKVGDTASMGTPVATISVNGSGSADGAGAAADASATAETDAGGAAVAEPAARRPRRSRRPRPRAAAGRRAAQSVPPAEGAPVYASPSARRLARELGVDLATRPGHRPQGPHLDRGRARRASERPAGTRPPAARRASSLRPGRQVDFEKYGEVERVPLSRIRKLSAAAVARNWTYIPHVTHNEEADVTELEAFRKQLNAEQSDVKVTMVALLLKACAATLAAFPDFNSSLDGDEVVRKRYYNIGFAADTPNGLVIPVVKDVDRKGLLELAGELTELSGKARAGKLGPAEMSGGTFTISSLGGIGGTSFTPIVSAPEVAILGVVRAAMRPVWDGSQFVPRLMLPLSLSYDHRVIDGAAAARFCAHLAGVLTDLRQGAAVSERLEVAVPDIGDFSDVPSSRCSSPAGQPVAVDDPLVVLESDKASMEIPAPQAGTIAELRVAVGDTVSEGSIVAVLDLAADGARRGAADRRRRAATAEPRRRASRAEPRRAAAARRAPANGAPGAQPAPAARRSRARRPSAATSTPACSCSARARAATRPRSAPPTSASTSCSSSATRRSAASA